MSHTNWKKKVHKFATPDGFLVPSHSNALTLFLCLCEVCRSPDLSAFICFYMLIECSIRFLRLVLIQKGKSKDIAIAKMEEELHVTCSTKNLVMIEDDHPDENRSFTSAGTCCTDLQELDDLIDDIFLNNMERQWCGKDHLMEHVEHIASLNAPVSFASMEDPFADMD